MELYEPPARPTVSIPDPQFLTFDTTTYTQPATQLNNYNTQQQRWQLRAANSQLPVQARHHRRCRLLCQVIRVITAQVIHPDHSKFTRATDKKLAIQK